MTVKQAKVEDSSAQEPVEHEPIPPSASAASSCWGTSNMNQTLHVRMADLWFSGMQIKDQQGNVAYKVLREDTVGRMNTGDPKFRATIANAEDEVVAVVIRKIIGVKDCFVVYSRTPNWAGQEAEPYMLGSNKLFDMYALASIQQSVLGRNYIVKSAENEKILLKAKNGNIRTTFLCCTIAILMGWCRWQLALYDPSQAKPRQTLILRDQDTETITLAPGSSPLMGLCIAYAVDRLTNPSC